jgi:autotransporter-associated beta strand protein
MDVRASGKSVAVLPGGDIEAFAYTAVSPSIGRSNSFAGNVSFTGPGLVRVANLAGLELQGTVQGPAGLVNADRGTLTLSGSNSYAGDVTVNLGQLNIASNDALPPNTTVTLSYTGIPSSDIVLAGLVSNTATPTSVTLNMISYRSPSGNLTPQLTGQGTWQGPIVMNAVQTDPSQNPQFTFAASSNLVIGSTVTQTGSPFAAVNINGFPGTVVFKSPLAYNGTMTMGSQGLGVDDLSQKFTTMELDSAGNSFTNMTFWRGKIVVGADNAIPITCPMTIPGVRTDNDARNIIDLHGHSQVFSNFPGAAGFAGSGAAPLWIGSDNTNADSTVVFTSPLTNTWYAWLLDNIDTNLVTTRRTGLTVTSGNLRLANLVWANWVYGGPAGATTNTYSGPTLVTGGTLQVDTPILNSTVTVSGTGRLAGSGPIYTPITIGVGSTLSPGGTTTTGSAIGILTNYNNLMLLSGSKCVFEVNLGTRTNDSVFGPANVSYGGTLVITNIGTQAFTNGTVLKLFTATNYTPGNVSIQPVVPGTNLMWDASQLAVNGTLRVTTTTPTSISGVGRLNDGNVTFTITGGVGQAYSVRASANVAAPVASWTVLESGTLPSSNYTFTDLNATNYPARFYIISTP